jgi:hypothetical protein
MLRAQKDFAKNPSSTNWVAVKRSMLVYQQLIQLTREARLTPTINTELANLGYVPMGEWPERIVDLSLGMSIDEAEA